MSELDLSIDAADVIRLLQAHLTECGLHGACKALRDESGIRAAGVLSTMVSQFKTRAVTGDWGWIMTNLSTINLSSVLSGNELLSNVYEMAILELADGGDFPLAYATLRLATEQLDRVIVNENGDAYTQRHDDATDTDAPPKDLAETIPKSRQIDQRLAALAAMRSDGKPHTVVDKKHGSPSSLPKDYYGKNTCKQERRDQLGQQLMESIPQIPSSRLTSLLQQAIKWQAYAGQLPIIKQHWMSEHDVESQQGERQNGFTRRKRKFDLVLGEAPVASFKAKSSKTLDDVVVESIPTKVFSTLSFGKRATAEVAVFLPDGSSLVTGSSDGLIEIWSATSRYQELRLDLPYQQTEELIGHDDAIITAVAVSNDGTVLATGDANGLVKVWRIDNGKCLREVAAHPNASISCLDLSHDASHVLTASQSTTCREYGLRTNRLLKEFRGHTSFINSCRYMIIDDSVLRVVTSSADGTARIWDGKTSEILHVLQPHSLGTSLTEKGMSVLQKMDSSIVEACPNLHLAIPLHTPIDSILLVPRGHRAFIVTLTGAVLQTYSVPVKSILVTASVSPSNHWLYAVTDDGTLHVFDMTSGDVERVIKNFAEATCGGSAGTRCPEITALAHHPHKGILCAFSNDKSQKRGRLTLWK